MTAYLDTSVPVEALLAGCADDDVRFSSADGRLNRAARALA